MRRFLSLFFALILLVCSANVVAAKYQFDDIAAPEYSGVGPQWVAFKTAVRADADRVEESDGAASSKTRLEVSGDIVSSNSPVYMSGDVTLTWPLHTVFFAMAGGSGTLMSGFRYSGSDGAVSTPISTGNFDGAYSVTATNSSPVPNMAYSDITFARDTTMIDVYDSTLGELILHQNPAITPSQTLHIPFVVANVYDGSAKEVPLELMTTVRDISDDIVGRRYFTWDAVADKTLDDVDSNWIFVPLASPDIDDNKIYYNFTTDVTNHTGLRYSVQRYDSDELVSADHWRFDLPYDDRLPQRLPLDPLSHIVPGLVTIYSQDALITSGQTKLFRLAAVDPTYRTIGSKALTLKYRTVFGYRLSTHTETAMRLNAFQVYPSSKSFFEDLASTMGVSEASFYTPERSADILQGNVSSVVLTADAMSSFTLDAKVPTTSGSVVSKDPVTSDDIWISADIPVDGTSLLPLHVELRIPKANRYILDHWDAFVKSQNLTNDFYEYFRVWLYSPSEDYLDMSKYLRSEGTQTLYNRVIKVFADEENECLTVHFILLLLESKEGSGNARPKIRVVSDTTDLNNYDYIAVNDGVADGRWNMTFCVAPKDDKNSGVGDDDKNSGGDSGGGGCSSLTHMAWLLLIPLLASKKRGLFLLLAAAVVSFSADEAYARIKITSVDIVADTNTEGTLSYAIRQHPDVVLIYGNNISRVCLERAVQISHDVVIEGNGVSIVPADLSAKNFRLFEVLNSADVTFRNMSFENGNPAAGDGGAVLISTDAGAVVRFEQCTFLNNTAPGSGGAVHVTGSDDVTFVNCTFFENKAGVNGGAVGAGAKAKLTFLFNTMVMNNTANGNGRAIYTDGNSNRAAACVFAGNTPSGKHDINTTGDKMASDGYNIFTDNGTAEDDPKDKTSQKINEIFGSQTITPRRNDGGGNDDEYWQNWPKTIALLDEANNPALHNVTEAVHESFGVKVDARYIQRKGTMCSGAYHLYNPAPAVESLNVGGIPNSLATVGSSAIINAYVLPDTARPELRWQSSNPDVAYVTPYGMLYSLSKGTATIQVKTSGYNSSGMQEVKRFVIAVKYDDISEDPDPDGITDPDIISDDPAPSDEGSKGGGGGGCSAGGSSFYLLLAGASFVVASIRKTRAK